MACEDGGIMVRYRRYLGGLGRRYGKEDCFVDAEFGVTQIYIDNSCYSMCQICHFYKTSADALGPTLIEDLFVIATLDTFQLPQQSRQ